jgi:hypothetical protein
MKIVIIPSRAKLSPVFFSPRDTPSFKMDSLSTILSHEKWFMNCSDTVIVICMTFALFFPSGDGGQDISDTPFVLSFTINQTKPPLQNLITPLSFGFRVG